MKTSAAGEFMCVRVGSGAFDAAFCESVTPLIRWTLSVGPIPPSACGTFVPNWMMDTNFVTGAIHAASHHPTVNEAQAIAQVKQGDLHAFTWLMGQYKHMVYTVVHRVLRNALDAEEATQDTFVKVFEKLSDHQGESKFSTWLFSIAYRTAISHLRKRRPATTNLDDLGNHAPKARDRDVIGSTDRTNAVTAALAELPEVDASIVSLYYLEELSVEEIVTVTGLGASNVKVKLHRSRKRLLEILQNEFKEETWTLVGN